MEAHDHDTVWFHSAAQNSSALKPNRNDRAGCQNALVDFILEMSVPGGKGPYQSHARTDYLHLSRGNIKEISHSGPKAHRLLHREAFRTKKGMKAHLKKASIHAFWHFKVLSTCSCG